MKSKRLLKKKQLQGNQDEIDPFKKLVYLPKLIIVKIYNHILNFLPSNDYTIDFIETLVFRKLQLICKDWNNTNDENSLISKLQYKHSIMIESTSHIKSIIRLLSIGFQFFQFEFNMNLIDIPKELVTEFHSKISPFINTLINSINSNPTEDIFKYFKYLTSLYLKILNPTHAQSILKYFETDLQENNSLIPLHITLLRLNIESQLPQPLLTKTLAAFEVMKSTLTNLSIVSIAATNKFSLKFPVFPNLTTLSLNLTTITIEDLEEILLPNQSLERVEIRVNVGKEQIFDKIFLALPDSLKYLEISILKSFVTYPAITNFLYNHRNLEEFVYNLNILPMDGNSEIVSSTSKSNLKSLQMKEFEAKTFFTKLDKIKSFWIYYLVGPTILGKVIENWTHSLKELVFVDIILKSDVVLDVAKLISLSNSLETLFISEYPNSISSVTYYTPQWDILFDSITKNKSLVQVYLDVFSITTEFIINILQLNHPKLTHFGCRYIKDLEHSTNNFIGSLLSNDTLVSLNISALLRSSKAKDNFDILLQLIQKSKSLKHLNFSENPIPVKLQGSQLTKLHSCLENNNNLESLELGFAFYSKYPLIYHVIQTKSIYPIFNPNLHIKSFSFLSKNDFI